MDRLQLEIQRLYLPSLAGGGTGEPGPAALVDGQGRVRAIVLALGRPADWGALSVVWQGVQADLALPAPAIAVAGEEGYQLWFSLAQPLPAARALAFVDALRQRYLADVRPQRLACWPCADVPPRHAPPVPAPLAAGGPWSAFVAQDLAPVFADETWLNQPPNFDGQAKLLAGLASMPLADFEHALAMLQPASAGALATGSRGLAPPASDAAAPTPQHMDAHQDPRQFLLAVMNTNAVPMALRIEAARALLACRTDPPP